MLKSFTKTNVNTVLDRTPHANFCKACDHFPVETMFANSHISNTLNFPERYYSYKYIVSPKQIVEAHVNNHTMDRDLHDYVFQKIPHDHLERIVKEDIPLRIEGIYPRHLEAIGGEKLGYDNLTNINFHHNPHSKKLNYIRPQFYTANMRDQQALVAAITPGRDYLYHYASILKYAINQLGGDAEKLFYINRYPLAELNIQEWSQLNSELVHENDVVILGYVQEFKRYIEKHYHSAKIQRHETDYYVSYRFTINGRSLNLLGVKFSFWGCMSAKLVNRVCELGATEILYLAKLGTMTNPRDLYNRIFVPTSYVIMHQHNIFTQIQDIPNRFLEMFPHLKSGTHISVPTVLEEQYHQRGIAEELGAETIDNEISQMAYAVTEYNNKNHNKVYFSPVHFATDYLRKDMEKDIYIDLSLRTNRTDYAKRIKRHIQDSIFAYVEEYIWNAAI